MPTKVKFEHMGKHGSMIHGVISWPQGVWGGLGIPQNRRLHIAFQHVRYFLSRTVQRLTWFSETGISTIE